MVEASVVEASFLLAAESTKGGVYSGGVVFLGGRCRVVDVGGQKSGRTR